MGYLAMLGNCVLQVMMPSWLVLAVIFQSCMLKNRGARLQDDWDLFQNNWNRRQEWECVSQRSVLRWSLQWSNLGHMRFIIPSTSISYLIQKDKSTWYKRCLIMPIGWLPSKNQRITNVVEDMEKSEPLCTVGAASMKNNIGRFSKN